MSSALTRRTRKLAKKMGTEELSVKIRELRSSISENTSLLHAAQKELQHRRNAENQLELDLGNPDGD